MPQDPQEILAKIQGSAPEAEDELPPTTVLRLDVTGVRGKRYEHDFVYTVPNIGKQIDIANMKAVLLPQGATADPSGAMIVEQISYLSVTLDPKRLPKWWKPMDMYDLTPISKLYKEALDYERRFHGEPRQGDGSGSGEDLDEVPGQDEGGREEEVDGLVGGGVQPPDKRRKTLSSSGR